MNKEIENKNIAIIYSSTSPSEKQKEGFKKFLLEKYRDDYEVLFEKDETIKNGFILKVGSEVYDWTVEGKFAQLKEAILGTKKEGENVISLLKETVESFKPHIISKEIGNVKTVSDGIANVVGLSNATFGEILVFETGAKGMVQEIKEDEIGCIIFDEAENVLEGAEVYRTGKTAGIPVGDNFIGRVIDALGNPIDGLGEIKAESYNEIEHKAPGIIMRKPVDTALKTGILSIDSMFPIGRGQRELIIGDRQTGKTQIALDTIINQRGKGVICIYVAIGQKNSSVVKIRETLKKYNALDYSIIVSASASEPSSLQYIAPYSGCAMAEYFMNKGKDVLIVYDDLSKHAVAYRALSLLLDRSPGREAYPGDVFYLHSRLLERSARLNENYGGGSITALPIVETQAGDVAAYIPTNIISITDGQIFLESDLFFSGQRPAVNVGLSVSRVGGDAQTKAMKKAVSTLKLDLAQFREMEVFTQFSSDLDDVTRNQLNHGQKLMRMLRQNLNSPYEESEEIVILLAALNHAFDDIDLEEVTNVKLGLIEYFKENHKYILERIEKEKVLNDDLKEEIISLTKAYIRDNG